MKYFLVLTVCLMSSASYAGVTINGTTITFNDATMQSTAKPSDHGGVGNTIPPSATEAFIGGGYNNTASGYHAMVGAGRNNIASGQYSSVAGGYSNTASANFSTVGGGRFNDATQVYSTVSGGDSNTASNNFSTVGGGRSNTASGRYSFVAGILADDLGHNNSFVWGGGAGFRTSAGPDTFNVWSDNGIYLNGSVEHSSDRNMKEGFSFVSAREVLDKVVELPVSTWRFKSEEDSVRHIGPMAQDFMAAFGYGKSNKHITATDADGVALAAIQGLNEKLEAQRVEDDLRRAEDAEVITALRWQNEQLKGMLLSREEAIEARFARLERAILRDGEREIAGSTD